MNFPKEVSLPDRPARSLSEKYILVIISGDGKQEYLQTFKILHQDQEVLFVANEWFDRRHALFILWDKEDRVWVYSGDVGTYYWEYDETSTSWRQHTYAESDVLAPEFLKEVRPKWHKR